MTTDEKYTKKDQPGQIKKNYINKKKYYQLDILLGEKEYVLFHTDLKYFNNIVNVLELLNISFDLEVVYKNCVIEDFDEKL